MDGVLDFFSKDAGQRRRQWLDETVGGAVNYFTPPNLRPAVNFAAQMNPIQGMGDAMQAGGIVFDPEQTAEARRRAALDMGIEMAMALTPAALAARGYLTPVQGVMEGLLGGSPAQQQIAQDAANLVSDVKYAGRSAAEGDIQGIFDVFRSGREGQSVGAASNDAPQGFLAYHGTPHDFPPVRLIEMPDGTRLYQNMGELTETPQGAKIIEEYPMGRFDLSKIGTGEGAQAYGYGLYFAEGENIARHYRDKLSKTQYQNELFIQGEPYNNPNAAQAKFMVSAENEVPISSSAFTDPSDYRYITRGMSKSIFDALMNAPQDVDPITAAQRAIDKYVSSNEFYADELDTVSAIAKSMLNKVSQDVSVKPSGNMYEVRINASPDEFINYDARLDEQSDLVKDVLGTGTETAAARLQRAYTNEMFGGDMIGQDRATPREVSQGLLSRGIKGIRYLDASSRGMGYRINLSRKGKPYETEPIEAGSRRQAEALAKEYQEKGFDTNIEAIGNRNMVVFDDQLVQIVRKYGIAGAAALLGVSSADIEGALAQGMPEQQRTGLLQ